MKKISRAVRSVEFEPVELRRLLATIVAAAPANGAQHVAVTSNLSVTFGEAVNASTLTSATVQLTDPNGVVIPTALAYSAATKTLTIDPAPTLDLTNSYYTLTVKGGAGGVADAAGGALAQDYSAFFTTGAPSFSTQTVFSGLNAPTNFEFSPDGRVFVALKTGIIDVYDSLTDTTPKVFADLRTEVHNFWDRGLLGLALDPHFTTGRPFVYALYTYDGDIGGPAPKWGTANTDSDGGGSSPTGTGAPVSCRLVKLTASGDTMTNEQVLIHDWPDQFPSHSIGDLRFGPDGYLYASGGDGASFNFADYGQVGNPLNDPINEGGALRSQDILSTGDPTQLNGTIIRIDPDTGLAAPGNPLTGDANRMRIIANGLRNPFRITFRPGTTELWVDDTGWDTYEEINRIQSVNAPIVQNFGWPAYEGPDVQSGYKGLNLPLLQPLYDDPSLVTSPYFSYKHADHVDPLGGDPTGSSSSTGLAFYDGNTFPAAYKNALFFADYSRSEIYVMYAGPNGLPDPATRQIFPTGTVGAVQLKVGPDGALYYAELNSGKIMRVVANVKHDPTAVITADKTSGGLPLTVNFSGANSTDPDAGQTLTYAWDLDGDGVFTDSTSAAPSFTYTTAGTWTVGLRVTDPTGLTSVTTARIVSGNSEPVPVISIAPSAQHWKVGDTIAFTGSATDAEDGTIPVSSLKWAAVMVYSNEIDPSVHQDRPLQQWTGVSGASISAPEWNYPAWLEIRLTATDSAGISTTVVQRLDPAISQVNLASNVVGAKITFNGNQYIAPASKTVLVGSTNTLSAPSSFVSDGITYVFASWSDGGTIVHDFAGLANDTTYTANYAATVNAPSAFAAAVVTGKSETILTWTDNSVNETAFVIERSTSPTFDTIDVTRTAVQGATFYNDWGLQQNITYYYRMRATAGAIQSVNSNVVTFKLAPPVAGVPNAPTVFAAVAGPSNSVAELSWVDNATNETAYVVQRSTSATFATIDATRTGRPDGTQYEDWGLTPGATYYYRLRAENGTDVSAWSSIVTFKAPSPPAGVPTAPTGFAVVAGPSNSEADLSWVDNSTNETAFVIQRSTSATFATIDITRTDRPGSQQYRDWGLTPGVTYYYRLRAENGTDVSAWTPTVTYQAPSPPAGIPTAPSGFAVIAGPSVSEADLSWVDNATNETAYVIQRSTSATFATIDVTRTDRANSQQYRDWGLTAGVTYYYRIRAENGSDVSSWSPTVTFTVASPTTLPATPTALKTTTLTNSQIQLNWTDPTGLASYYVVQRSTSATFATFTALANSSYTGPYVDWGLSANTTYYYRVMAVNGAGQSAFSTIVSGITLA